VPRIRRRVVPKSPAGKPVELHGGQFGNEVGPLVDGRLGDPKGRGDRSPPAVKANRVRRKHRRRLQHTVSGTVKGTVMAAGYNRVANKQQALEGDLSLAKLVRDARKAANLTQPELAKRIGVTTAAISEIERGRTKTLKAKMAEGLNRILGIPSDVLAGRRASPMGGGVYSPAVGQDGPHISRVRIVGSAHVNSSGEWLRLELPALPSHALEIPSEDPSAYAIRILGDAFHPRVKAGEYLVLEPQHQIEPGDEVHVTLRDGRSMLREVAWRKDGETALNGVVDRHQRLTVSDDEIIAIHYVAAITKHSRFRAE
jgi:transcriptional regulator with XRE-family HTH domain